MSLALHGHGTPPLWATTLAMAEAWGIPPWEVEEHASAEWADRFIVWRNAQAEMMNPKKIAGKGKRLI